MPAVAWWLLTCRSLPEPCCLCRPESTVRWLASSATSWARRAFFAVGTLALFLIVLTQRDLPALQSLKALSWWQWTGGLLGASLSPPPSPRARTGALLFMALLLAGQLFVALLLDHFGWAGFRQSPISLGKVAGLLLIFGGVWLIQRG